MLRIATSPFEMQFKRSGGALTIARLDVWKAAADDWQPAGQFALVNSTLAAETQQGTLTAGDYTCVFQCYVEESLNGKYAFEFSIGGKPTYADDGDVNTTSARNDSKVFKDQFILRIA